MNNTPDLSRSEELAQDEYNKKIETLLCSFDGCNFDDPQISGESFTLDFYEQFDYVARNKIVFSLNKDKVSTLFFQGNAYNISLLYSILEYENYLKDIYVFYDNLSFLSEVTCKSFFDKLYTFSLGVKTNIEVCLKIEKKSNVEEVVKFLKEFAKYYGLIPNLWIELLFFDCESDIPEYIYKKGLGEYYFKQKNVTNIFNNHIKKKLAIREYSAVSSQCLIEAIELAAIVKNDKERQVFDFSSNDIFAFAEKRFFSKFSLPEEKNGMLLFSERNYI